MCSPESHNSKGYKTLLSINSPWFSVATLIISPLTHAIQLSTRHTPPISLLSLSHRPLCNFCGSCTAGSSVDGISSTAGPVDPTQRECLGIPSNIPSCVSRGNSTQFVGRVRGSTVPTPKQLEAAVHLYLLPFFLVVLYLMISMSLVT